MIDFFLPFISITDYFNFHVFLFWLWTLSFPRHFDHWLVLAFKSFCFGCRQFFLPSTPIVVCVLAFIFLCFNCRLFLSLHSDHCLFLAFMSCCFDYRHFSFPSLRSLSVFSLRVFSYSHFFLSLHFLRLCFFRPRVVLYYGHTTPLIQFLRLLILRWY